MFIIAITGCLYAFKTEIENATQTYRYVEAVDSLNLRPTEFARIARTMIPDQELHSINIKQQGEAVEAIFYEEQDRFYQAVYIHPNTGKVLKRVDLTANFFDFVLQGHYYLWLPPWLGQPIVATATLIFFFMLLSGIILWWPRNRNARKQRFWFRWKKKSTRWKRKNYDLHNIFGFYVSSLALVFVLTGLVWGFQFFGVFVYWIAGGEKSAIYTEPPSLARSSESDSVRDPVDDVYELLRNEYPDAYAIELHLPHDSTSSVYAMIRPDAGTYYASDYRFFDQYTLEEIEVDQIYGKYKDASAADQLIRMNYDIHIGAIGGLGGKILAFIASLLCASLPVTGFMIWLGRKKKKKKVLVR